MTKVFQLVLDGKPEEAVKYAKDTVHNTLKGNVELSALVISKSVSEFSSYVDLGSPENRSKQQHQLSGGNANIALGSSLVHVKVAGQLQEMGYDFTPGMKTPFIITDGSIQPQKAEPIIEGIKFTARPDYKYYAERLAMALARITEPFGCDERALLQGNSQRSLEFFCEEKPAPKAEPPLPQAAVKKVKQKATLDMFM
jgi:DNA polymerase I